MAKIKHGQAHSKLYFVWAQMKGRCYNKNNPEYKNYGARGIKVCEAWKQSAEFLTWAHNAGYREGLTLDRINVDGIYCPENCRWVDMHVQNANKRILTRNTSGATGVYVYKNGRKHPYQSYIGRKTIGFFDTLEDAITARANYIKEHNLTEYMKTGSIFV